jgi:glycosyltransferase involved in cell wall biosynthesis
VPGDAAFRVHGWALFPSGPVAKVELEVDGRQLSPARVGLPRPDIEALSTNPDAPVCGFETWLQPGEASGVADKVTISGRVLGVYGDCLPLLPVTAALRPATASIEPTRKAVIRRQIGARPRDYGLKLLAVTHELEFGSDPIYLAALLPRLASDYGVASMVVSLQDGPLRSTLERSGVCVHISPSCDEEDPVRYAERMEELIAWATLRHFDIVHANGIATYLAVELAERLGLPVLWVIHESPSPAEWWAVSRTAVRGYGSARMEHAFASASHVMFGSEWSRRRFEDHVDTGRTTVLPHGIDLEAIARHRDGRRGPTSRTRLGLREGETVLLCLAAIEPPNAQTALTIAFAQLACRYSDTRLALVGETARASDKSYTAALREYVKRAQLQERVIVAPATPHPYDWLSVADVSVLASDAEALPVTVLQSMAFELPTLSTAVSGVSDLIEDGRNGYLCARRDVSALVSALDRVLGEEPDRRRGVARAGAGSIRARHDIRQYAAKYAELIGKLAGRESTLSTARG